ncbi:MAG TPA: ferritin family protein [Deferrisomatales bacterium]|nr:ferritin family protein [Deferrisomatales bacterium]
MDGGIDAWHGHVSEARVDQGVYLLEGDETPAALFAVAYRLEEATRRFYQRIARETATPGVRELADALSRGEETHQERIRELCRDTCGEAAATQALGSGPPSAVLEDGSSPAERLERLLPADATPAAVLDLAMALEVDALDLYLRFTHHFRQPSVRNALFALAREEQCHLKRLGDEWARLP